MLIGQAHKSALIRNNRAQPGANIRDDGWRQRTMRGVPFLLAECAEAARRVAAAA